MVVEVAAGSTLSLQGLARSSQWRLGGGQRGCLARGHDITHTHTHSLRLHHPVYWSGLCAASTGFQGRADSSDWMMACQSVDSTVSFVLFFFVFFNSALLEGLSPPVLSVPKATQEVQVQPLCFCVDVVAHAAQCWVELLGSWRVIVTIWCITSKVNPTGSHQEAGGRLQ